MGRYKKCIDWSIALFFIVGCQHGYADSEENGETNRNASFAGNIEYRPDLCKKNAEGNVYVALGKTVFRFPYETNLQFRAVKDSEDLPHRPDPTEPEGCPDNPVATKGIRLNYRLKDTGGMSADLKLMPESISLTYSGYSSGVFQDRAENRFYQAKGSYNNCEYTEEGLEACYWKSADERPKHLLAVGYKAPESIYKTPLGRPFFVDCRGGGAIPLNQCTVSYVVNGRVDITYKFYKEYLPISVIVKYDAELRDIVEKAMVVDYKWSDN
ncbi:hypothetical protein EUZ85_21290 [Hahella sp. KA22]|uniref:hypothetical protein n=1 Tax=Hahella sp. KA22 TaxID=1628392 RepID=UPI000FDF64CB|nr:hypothetical protein [Hahella sp. KA22]AZZ93114.1 hypothetical protein ENC22_18705 [Hahella sp. KA22]QAY56488.1 hypothetical protein EUZ85_21290 [Hahella sp. KA22]